MSWCKGCSLLTRCMNLNVDDVHIRIFKRALHSKMYVNDWASPSREPTSSPFLTQIYYSLSTCSFILISKRRIQQDTGINYNRVRIDWKVWLQTVDFTFAEIDDGLFLFRGFRLHHTFTNSSLFNDSILHTWCLLVLSVKYKRLVSSACLDVCLIQ